MTTYKIKYKHYISNLYLPELYSGKTIILLPGLPSSTNINNLVQEFLNIGAVVFYPYYSGSFDSEGIFSMGNSIKDVASFYELGKLEKIKELYRDKELQLGKAEEIILVGMSYGAAVALHGHKNVYDKVVLLSPALVFNPADLPNQEIADKFHQQMQHLVKFLSIAMPFSYRIRDNSDLNNFLLGKDKLSSRQSVVDTFNGTNKPILIIHGNNDTSVPSEVSKNIQGMVSNNSVTFKYTNTGHSSSSYNEEVYSILRNFILK